MAFGAYYTNKSYYHRFTTINFAKPSWRAYTSMIPFIPNLAESGGSHRDNHHFQRMIARKERTAPQHTRFILPPIHPDKIHRCAAWAVFFFMRNVPWKFHKPTGRDTDFPSPPLRKQGQELRSEQTVTPLHKQRNSLLIFAS